MEKEPADFLDWLQALNQENLNYFIGGGQAVNVWALRYLNEAPELREYFPFNSKDCDIWIDHNTFREIPNILKGNLVKSMSPLDGQLGILSSLEDPDKKLDLLSGIYGIKENEIKNKGKCHNHHDLPQKDRNDLKHLNMLSLLIPDHLEMIIEPAEDPNSGITGRDALKEIKLLLSFQKDTAVKETLLKMEIPLSELLPQKRMRSSPLQELSKFTQTNFPESD